MDISQYGSVFIIYKGQGWKILENTSSVTYTRMTKVLSSRNIFSGMNDMV
jgi:hypothetical protein